MIPTSEQILSEIQNDPAGIGYAGKTVPEIFDLLNNPTRTVRRGCDGLDVFNYLVKTPVWEKLDAASENTDLDADYPGLRRRIKKFLVTTQTLKYLRFAGNNELLQSIAGLEQLGIITSMEAEVFLMLGDVEMSRAAELWGDEVSVGIGFLSRALLAEQFAAAEADYAQKRAAMLAAETVLAQLSRGEVTA